MTFTTFVRTLISDRRKTWFMTAAHTPIFSWVDISIFSRVGGKLEALCFGISGKYQLSTFVRITILKIFILA